MNYEQTKIKSPLKNYVSFSLSDIWNYDTFQTLEEDSINWNLQDCIYQHGKDLYNFDGMLEEVKKYLLSELRISEKELSQWDEQIADELIRACAYAYENSYMGELLNYFRNEVKEKVEEIINDLFPDIQCKIAYYSSEDKSLHSEVKYNTDEIRIFIPKNNATIKFLNNELNNFELREIKEGFSDAICEYYYGNTYHSSYKINLEHFDYYGTRGDYDDYLEAFKEYNEVEYQIKKSIEQKCKHTKQMIKNRVALIYR
jgi:hypothetical protein